MSGLFLGCLLFNYLFNWARWFRDWFLLLLDFGAILLLSFRGTGILFFLVLVLLFLLVFLTLVLSILWLLIFLVVRLGFLHTLWNVLMGLGICRMEQMLRIDQMRRDETMLRLMELGAKRLRSTKVNWSWSKILVWIKASKSNDISEARQLDHWLGLDWTEMNWANGLSIHKILALKILVFMVVVISRFILSVILQFFRHWWKSYSFWKIWEWVDKPSSFFVIVEERAAISEFALTVLKPVSAWLSFIV